jgi:hypothetical protein
LTIFKWKVAGPPISNAPAGHSEELVELTDESVFTR